MNTYFNEQSLGILRTLKLTFVSKSNDKRVEKVNSGITGLEEEEPIVEEKVEEVKEEDNTADYLFEDSGNTDVQFVLKI